MPTDRYASIVNAKNTIVNNANTEIEKANTRITEAEARKISIIESLNDDTTLDDFDEYTKLKTELPLCDTIIQESKEFIEKKNNSLIAYGGTFADNVIGVQRTIINELAQSIITALENLKTAHLSAKEEYNRGVSLLAEYTADYPQDYTSEAPKKLTNTLIDFDLTRINQMLEKANSIVENL